MFGDGSLTFREFAVGEPLPLATIQDAVLEFLRGRDDAALFGAQAVNAYVDESRATQDVDILALHGREFAESLRSFLHQRFHVSVRVREIIDDTAFRVFQLQKPKNRHLVDVRAVEDLPDTQRVRDVLVLAPPELVAEKVIAFTARQGKPKAFTDRRDIAVLLLTFPTLKTPTGEVADRLRVKNADEKTLAAWQAICEEQITAEGEDSGY
jgi:hypothetical protein